MLPFTLPCLAFTPQANITTGYWTKNPIPKSATDFAPPFAGGVDSHWPFSLVDQVVLPPTLPLGDYLLSWRWDTELTSQV